MSKTNSEAIAGEIPAVTPARRFLEKAAEQTQDQFTLTLWGDEKVTFRLPTRSDEYEMIGARARKFAEMCLSERIPPAMKPFQPKTRGVGVAAYWVHSLSVEPALSQADALELGKVAGPTLLLLWQSLMEHLSPAMDDKIEEDFSELGEG